MAYKVISEGLNGRDHQIDVGMLTKAEVFLNLPVMLHQYKCWAISIYDDGKYIGHAYLLEGKYPRWMTRDGKTTDIEDAHRRVKKGLSPNW